MYHNLSTIASIPGTTNSAHFVENIKALDIKLSTDDLKSLNKVCSDNPQIGIRFPEELMKWHCQ